MAIIINIDMMLAKRKMSVSAFSKGGFLLGKKQH